jgi:hypothetical protein
VKQYKNTKHSADANHGATTGHSTRQNARHGVAPKVRAAASWRALTRAKPSTPARTTKHRLKNTLPKSSSQGVSAKDQPICAKGSPNQPRGPHSDKMPSAATSVGTTKGSISARCHHKRPRNSSRASTQAMGRPSTKHSTHVTSACTSVQPMRKRRCASCHHGPLSSRAMPATGSPHRPWPSKRATGAAKAKTTTNNGSAASQKAWRPWRIT